VERLIMVRHGQSEASAAGLVNGDPTRPIHLTEIGRSEARALGERVAHERIDLCAVTSFPRTWETADIALAGRDVPRIVVRELDDPGAGRFEGGPISTFRDWFRANGAGTRILGGESRVETVRRYVGGLRTLAGRDDPTILLVAHGLPVTYALFAARGEALPLTLESAQVRHATPYQLDGEDLNRAIQGLEAWVGDHEVSA
jgi:probable phosphoglycerate mutase